MSALRFLPPPIWAILLLTSLYYLSEAPALQALPDWRHKPAGMILIVLGLIPPMISIGQFFLAGTQVHPTSKANNKLVTTGFFAFTRNPMYLGLVVASIGFALWFGRPLMFLAPILIFAIENWVFIPFEEAKMRRQFPEAFDAYCKRVRRWL
ncbi:MAG: isoprenylcysteine carboxylmethyltransferase family protein [Hyphomonadaceae bacterium]|nr:isoprenylcysteine carboxylmethyltransferase family protein [Hyphomonadaceae bacterium]MCA8886345.1 isoprenylcysteine carboxylmethyltransferase family protein [Hyphomonadaceae bacterium]